MNNNCEDIINFIELTQYVLEILNAAKYISDGDIENHPCYEEIVEKNFNGKNIYILSKQQFNDVYSALQQLLKKQQQFKEIYFENNS